jgi:hypothetical protein
VLEIWVQHSVDGMLFSWVRGWVHTVISVDESMNSLLNLLVSDILLLSQVLEVWVQDTIDGVLLPWVWSWVH